MRIDWTEEETNKLVENYSTHTKKEIMEMFPNRSFLSIYKKARTFKLSKDKNIDFKERSNRNTGENNPNWKGGKKGDGQGHIMLRTNKKEYRFEHRVIFEREAGIKVPKNCCVHHINGDKKDNRIENLCMMTHKAHTLLHHCGTKRSIKTKKKLSGQAKKRLSDKTKHPRYKNIDIEGMLKLRSSGATIKSICEKYNINKSTYYKKVREYNNVK